MTLLAHGGRGARVEQASFDKGLERLGDWLSTHQAAIRRVQWAVVAVYATLLVAPVFLPAPVRTSHIWTHLTLFSQFVFWGLWWPFVLLSMALVGRAWCGLLCPEGALTEVASERGLGRSTPHWIKWRGWPFAAFALTTIYGQMVSVYQYPKPALLVLGGSTVAAVVVGALYGRDKRVWCRFLCPVTGVFGLLTKLAPFHFRVDAGAWAKAPRHSTGHLSHVNCAPLVPIRTMKGSSACHMCGRCSGFKGAISLARRSPMEEIVSFSAEPRPWETVLILFGLMGVAVGAFHWTTSDLYIAIKQFLAERLIGSPFAGMAEPVLPWWALTNYPAQNDVMTPLDGIVLVGYMGGAALLVGGALALCLALATRVTGRWSSRVFHHLAQGLIPLAGCGVFLGLSAITVAMLRGEGFALGFVGPLRMALLAGAGMWALAFGWRILGLYARPGAPRIAAMIPYGAAVGVGVASWTLLFWPV